MGRVTRKGPTRSRRGRRAFLIDLGPLRRSRDFRLVVGGQLVSVLGSQMTAVAVPYQVYAMTRSSLAVGLVSLALVPTLIIGAVVGGAMVPGLVERREVATANATLQALFQFGAVAGPAITGLVLAGTGPAFVYWADAVTFLVVAVSMLRLGPQPPGTAADRPATASVREYLRSLGDGLRFARSRQGIQGAFLIDINATVLGMPRALFPALAANVFGGGAVTLGFLSAAPGAGALIGAVTTGWVGRVRRQGRAVIIAVIVWGLAIAGFGLACLVAPGPAHRDALAAGPALARTGLTHADALALVAGLVLLAVAGWADVISAVFRNTIVQLSAPGDLRGRLTGLQTAVVNAGPRLGDVEAGVVASVVGTTASVLSGGLGCVAGALVIARLLPEFRRQRAAEPAAGTTRPAQITPVS